MNRLTERDEFGNADIVGVDGADLQLNLAFDEFNLVTEALNRLAAYEDAGLTPEEVMGLAQAKQDGRLVVLPCKVGDIAFVTDRAGTPRKMKLEAPDIRFVCTDEDNLCRQLCDRRPAGICAYRIKTDSSDIGKRIFLTREEAEAAFAVRDGGPKQSGS